MSEKRKPESNKNSGKSVFSSSNPHKIPRIWVIVADRHIARVFSKRGDDISQVAKIVSQATKDPKMTNKSLGRVIGSSGSAVHHKYEPHMNESHKGEITFAHEISAWLDAEAGKETFDRLVLIASPHMLGELRKTISQHVYARIVAELNKDLTKMSEAALRAELGKILWF
ncbi:MAG: host attachment protein [Proteobacteria bacterium]|nr:host attachment protein [Pseudomonadota bacterium]